MVTQELSGRCELCHGEHYERRLSRPRPSRAALPKSAHYCSVLSALLTHIGALNLRDYGALSSGRRVKVGETVLTISWQSSVSPQSLLGSLPAVERVRSGSYGYRDWMFTIPEVPLFQF